MTYRELLNKLQDLPESELDLEIAFYNGQFDTLAELECSDGSSYKDALEDYYPDQKPSLVLQTV